MKQVGAALPLFPLGFGNHVLLETSLTGPERDVL